MHLLYVIILSYYVFNNNVRQKKARVSFVSDQLEHNPLKSILSFYNLEVLLGVQ